MNFSITSGEQSLQVFTATLTLSPLCSVQVRLGFLVELTQKERSDLDLSKVTLPATRVSRMLTALL